MAKTTINLPAGSTSPFSSLRGGECFVFEGELYMKAATRTASYSAYSMDGGERAYFTPNQGVQPVDVEINVSLPK